MRARDNGSKGAHVRHGCVSEDDQFHRVRRTHLQRYAEMGETRAGHRSARRIEMKLPITLACGLYDRTFALLEGTVPMEGEDLNYLPMMLV